MRALFVILLLALTAACSQKPVHSPETQYMAEYVREHHKKIADDCVQLQTDIMNDYDRYWTIRTSEQEAARILTGAELSAKWQRLLGCRE
jgi:hypothetical protein